MDLQPDRLRDRLLRPLPGLSAHAEVMSYVRQSANEVRERRNDYREGAVLVLLYKHVEVWHTSLIVRPTYDGVHSGQVAFPGGKRDTGDPDLLFTALREANEEVGVNPQAVTPLGQLSEIYIPPSNFLVRPFVGMVSQRPDFRADPREVASILEVPLSHFLAIDAVKKETVRISTGLQMKVDGFEVDGHLVWGATAMMLAELRAVLSELL
ncbi:MAG: NUDIX hydrolase [Flavobacteriales bacterium]|jgi:8-oxo-dGTP pyrophosphatase MutT (NUDIX family)